jgi:CHAT domain-containing protein
MALALARTHRMSAEIQAATANLALAHWHSGKKQLARDTYLQSATEAENQGDYANAELALNNLGALQFSSGDFRDGAVTFRRAVALTETARARLSPEERIRFLGSRLSAYQFLVRCLERTGDAAGVFEISNAMRGRSLAETIAVGEPPAVALAAFQASLAPDETALFYTVVGPAELVIQVVDQKTTSMTYVDGRPLLAPLKKTYLDRVLRKRPGYKPLRPTVSVDGTTYQNVSAADQITTDDFEQVVELLRGLIDGSVEAPADLRAKVLPEFLGTFAQMLVQPVAKRFGEQRKLILFPDQVLYFVPFEALPVSGGRYLVEQSQVRYSQSAAVWSLLKSRQYPSDRKAFFGMGGALYSAMEEQAPPLSDATRHLQLQVQAQRNAVEGRSQREIYAAIFGPKPMNYLQGSLVEVEVLSLLFPDATVFTGEDMSESRIKAMVKDASLANYRIVHLATHGFVLPETPELSGVAMSIFPKERDGEDGYLTAPEVARLGLRADLAVLSACDTGRGRIYGGEGVQGLTGSLLVGGANRALVSLWPVSDAGTMRFMTDMYALTLSDGLSYDEAVNVVKRRFIAGAYGEAFRDVRIWAPFVHYGR